MNHKPTTIMAPSYLHNTNNALVCQLVPNVIVHLHHHQVGAVPGRALLQPQQLNSAFAAATAAATSMSWTLKDMHHHHHHHHQHHHHLGETSVPGGLIPQLSLPSHPAGRKLVVPAKFHHQHQQQVYACPCQLCMFRHPQQQHSVASTSDLSSSYSPGSSYYSHSGSASPSVASSSTTFDANMAVSAAKTIEKEEDEIVSIDETEGKAAGRTMSTTKTVAGTSMSCPSALSVPPSYFSYVPPPPPSSYYPPPSSTSFGLPLAYSSGSVAALPPPGVTLRDYYASLGVYYNLVPWNQSYGMERVWMSEFRRVFSAFYNELWTIQPVERKPTGVRLNMFVDSAKVRFSCERCGHSWTSMKGRIVFWFALLSPNFNTGIVAIKLFGQRCVSCSSETFQQPMWYPEEVTKVLINLYNRVGQIFYGFEKTRFEKQRRVGKPRTPHNQFLCQACNEGICLNRRSSTSAAPGKLTGGNAEANKAEVVANEQTDADKDNNKTKEEESVEKTSESTEVEVVVVGDDQPKKLLNSDSEDEFEERCSEDSGL